MKKYTFKFIFCTFFKFIYLFLFSYNCLHFPTFKFNLQGQHYSDSNTKNSLQRDKETKRDLQAYILHKCSGRNSQQNKPNLIKFFKWLYNLIKFGFYQWCKNGSTSSKQSMRFITSKTKNKNHMIIREIQEKPLKN